MSNTCNKDYCDLDYDPDAKQKEKLQKWLKELGFDKKGTNE